MSAKLPDDPRDVADMLDALARRIRSDPSFAGQAQAQGPGEQGSHALSPSELVADGPSLGALDVLTDDKAVTVTCETHNTDASHVRVSLLAGRLLIGLGEGPGACKRDLPLPAAVDEDAAVATFRNGVLDVVLPLKRR